MHNPVDRRSFAHQLLLSSTKLRSTRLFYLRAVCLCFDNPLLLHACNVHDMGLLTIIRKNRRKEREMRILFLGLDNAGKTTILKRLNGEDIMSVSPTLGFNIKTFIHQGYTLNIWDVGGQRTLRPYWRNYFEQTDAIVWVVDSGDRLRMEDCKQELHTLLQEDRLAGATLLVFANKQDIKGALTSSEIRTALDLDGIKSHQWSIMPCSAVTGYNVLEGINWAVEDVAGRLYYGATFGAPVALAEPFPPAQNVTT